MCFELIWDLVLGVGFTFYAGHDVSHRFDLRGVCYFRFNCF